MRLCHALLWGLAATATAIGSAGCEERRDLRAVARGPNQVPLGVIEVPAEGQAIPPSVTIRGWAADDRGVRSIMVLVDGVPSALAGLTWARPDVTQVYPLLKHGTDRHGWEAVVDIHAAGPHTVSAIAVDSDGVSSVLGQRQVIVSAR